MYKNKHFAFAHLQKCGGTTLKNIFVELFGGEMDKHTPHVELRPSYMDELPVLSSVRNPLDWYVSWWAHGCRDKGLTYRNHRNEFWLQFYEDASNPLMFRAWLNAILNTYPLEERFAKYRFFTAGLVTRRFLTICCRESRTLEKHWIDDPDMDQEEIAQFIDQNCYVDGFITCEDFNETLFAGIQATVGQVSEEHREFIENFPPMNTSSELPVDVAYNDECLELVIKKEEAIFDKFQYDKIGL